MKKLVCNLLTVAASLALMAGIANSEPLKTKLMGTIKTDKPAFLFLEESSRGTLDLLIASFKVFGTDEVKAVIDIPSYMGRIDSAKVETWSSSLKWPNEVRPTPAKVFGEGHYTVASGFLVPGKGNGAITILNPETKKELTLTKTKKGWWYHQATWIDMNKDGKLDVLTARGRKGMFGGSGGEFVWLEQPSDPTQVPWKEHMIRENGPDVFFKVTDLNNDGDIEIIATEFFAKKLTILWQEGSRWITRTIDKNIGAAFALEITDVNNDGKLDILATNHEGKAHKAAIFAYEVPFNIFTDEFPRHTLLTNIPTLQGGMGQASPGEAMVFHPFLDDTSGKPHIAAAGDGSQKAHILIPNSEDPNDWTYEEQILVHTKSTVGKLAIGDVDGNGVSEVFVPGYDNNQIYIYTFEK